MLADPSLNIDLEGHTIGTAEYNIALSERRSATVRDYFLNRGIAGSRLRTSS